LAEGLEQIILPFKEVSGQSCREIDAKLEFSGATMTVAEQFVGDDVNTACVAMTGKEAIPTV
jgi:hypothetical protein